MTASRVPTRRTSFTTPVIDYEPAPIGAPPPAPCPPPSSTALHRHSARPLRLVPVAVPAQVLPRTAAVFADNALRRVLEVADRRRPVAQLRPLLAPTLFDATVTTLTRAASGQGSPAMGSAILRRVRLQPASLGSSLGDGHASAAEVFATYTRGTRVRAIAGRIELIGGRWVVVALQIG